jgi:hypothetical protein
MEKEKSRSNVVLGGETIEEYPELSKKKFKSYLAEFEDDEEEADRANTSSPASAPCISDEHASLS